MEFTVQQIDQKILQAELALAELTKKLTYWKSVRDLLKNPLFAELSLAPLEHLPSVTPILYQVESRIPNPPRKYGEIKRLSLECLPDNGDPVTSRELVERIKATGFVFETKTPLISVNDTLKTLQKEHKVTFKGKSSSNAGLWGKTIAASGERDWLDDVAENEKEATEVTS